MMVNIPHREFIVYVVIVFSLGYGFGYMTGKAKGENIGLRAQDSKAITTLGVTVTALNRELKIANRVMNAVAKRDSTGEYEQFMNTAIQQLRDKK